MLRIYFSCAFQNLFALKYYLRYFNEYIMYLLGYDVGSSSIKAALIDAQTGRTLASAVSPKQEMEILSPHSGYAEQHPQVWWEHIKSATAEIKSAIKFNPADIKALGISYQMHGLVLIDKDRNVLRPAIIWCDGRAVETGKKAADEIGEQKCFEQMLNLPGNFTASRLAWVKQNEPAVYHKIYKFMLPGDYIAMRMTDKIATTISGLSEAILWDFSKRKPAETLLDYFGIDHQLLCPAEPAFAVHGELTKAAAAELGLSAGIKVSYRAGDQPNNALSLNVLNPGEAAATAGTSGAIYGISDKVHYDSKGRVNTFVHVNDGIDGPRHGVLLCVNGTGILNSWLRKNTAETLNYEQMNELAITAPPGCEGLCVFPFGNGPERMLSNKDSGAGIYGLRFNTHTRAHLLRAAQEGIVFGLNYGLQIMKHIGINVKTVRAGHANMFLSPLFAKIFATVTSSAVELYNTDGAIGAARGAGIGAGIYKKISDAFAGIDRIKVIDPDRSLSDSYANAYGKWLDTLNRVV